MQYAGKRDVGSAAAWSSSSCTVLVQALCECSWASAWGRNQAEPAKSPSARHAEGAGSSRCSAAHLEHVHSSGELLVLNSEEHGG